MKKLHIAFFTALLIFSGSLFAQEYGQKKQIELGAFGGYILPGDYAGIEPKNGFMGGLRLGYWMTNSLSTELSGQRAFSEDGAGGSNINMDGYRLNVLWNLMPAHRIRPFLTLGAGLERFGFAVTGGDYVLAYNGGIGSRFFINNKMGVRVEGRYVMVNEKIAGEDYQYNIEGQLGLFFLFGGGHKKEVAPPPTPTLAPVAEPAPVPAAPVDGDSDSDGILDSKDKCANTAADTKVDETGCTPEVVKKTKGALKGVTFLFGKAELTENSKKILNEVATAMKEITDGKVEVQGHTDNIGGSDVNLKVSQARAQSVADYLMEQGVDEKRLSWKGYGDSQSVADNKTSAGRAQNRRVELKWLD